MCVSKIRCFVCFRCFSRLLRIIIFVYVNLLRSHISLPVYFLNENWGQLSLNWTIISKLELANCRTLLFLYTTITRLLSHTVISFRAEISCKACGNFVLYVRKIVCCQVWTRNLHTIMKPVADITFTIALINRCVCVCASVRVIFVLVNATVTGKEQNSHRLNCSV